MGVTMARQLHGMVAEFEATIELHDLSARKRAPTGDYVTRPPGVSANCSLHEHLSQLSVAPVF
jgi:hypothetical protein